VRLQYAGERWEKLRGWEKSYACHPDPLFRGSPAVGGGAWV